MPLRSLNKSTHPGVNSGQTDISTGSDTYFVKSKHDAGFTANAKLKSGK